MIMMMTVEAPLITSLREEKEPEIQNLPKEGPSLPSSGLNTIQIINSIIVAIKPFPAGS